MMRSWSGLFNSQSIEVDLALNVDCISFDEVLVLEDTLRHMQKKQTIKKKLYWLNFGGKIRESYIRSWEMEVSKKGVVVQKSILNYYKIYRKNCNFLMELRREIGRLRVLCTSSKDRLDIS